MIVDGRRGVHGDVGKFRKFCCLWWFLVETGSRMRAGGRGWTDVSSVGVDVGILR